MIKYAIGERVILCPPYGPHVGKEATIVNFATSSTGLVGFLADVKGKKWTGSTPAWYKVRLDDESELQGPEEHISKLVKENAGTYLSG